MAFGHHPPERLQRTTRYGGSSAPSSRAAFLRTRGAGRRSRGDALRPPGTARCTFEEIAPRPSCAHGRLIAERVDVRGGRPSDADELPGGHVPRVGFLANHSTRTTRRSESTALAIGRPLAAAPSWRREAGIVLRDFVRWDARGAGAGGPTAGSSGAPWLRRRLATHRIARGPPRAGDLHVRGDRVGGVKELGSGSYIAARQVAASDRLQGGRAECDGLVSRARHST